jgi:excisionase family DNA binding protein
MKEGTQPMSDDHRSPYRIPEAARRLEISDQQTRKALLRGELEGFGVGRLWLVRPESVDRLLRGENREHESSDSAA